MFYGLDYSKKWEISGCSLGLLNYLIYGHVILDGFQSLPPMENLF